MRVSALLTSVCFLTGILAPATFPMREVGCVLLPNAAASGKPKNTVPPGYVPTRSGHIQKPQGTLTKAGLLTLVAIGGAVGLKGIADATGTFDDLYRLFSIPAVQAFTAALTVYFGTWQGGVKYVRDLFNLQKFRDLLKGKKKSQREFALLAQAFADHFHQLDPSDRKAFLEDLSKIIPESNKVVGGPLLEQLISAEPRFEDPGAFDGDTGFSRKTPSPREERPAGRNGKKFHGIRQGILRGTEQFGKLFFGMGLKDKEPDEEEKSDGIHKPKKADDQSDKKQTEQKASEQKVPEQKESVEEFSPPMKVVSPARTFVPSVLLMLAGYGLWRAVTMGSGSGDIKEAVEPIWPWASILTAYVVNVLFFHDIAVKAELNNPNLKDEQKVAAKSFQELAKEIEKTLDQLSDDTKLGFKKHLYNRSPEVYRNYERALQTTDDDTDNTGRTTSSRNIYDNSPVK